MIMMRCGKSFWIYLLCKDDVNKTIQGAFRALRDPYANILYSHCTLISLLLQRARSTGRNDMKTAKIYAANAAYNMENAVHQMQPALSPSKRTPLPVTTQEIISYVEQLLTPDEEFVCNTATD
jgi:hypothetical protein